MARSQSRAGAALLLAACLLAPISASAQTDATTASGYRVFTLVTDSPPAKFPKIDPHLINPWGIAALPDGPFWIADNGTGLSTLYDGAGNVIPAVFTVPPPAGQAGPAAPSGLVANTSSGFHVPGTSIPAAFIFSTEDGTISAWAGGLTTNPQTAVLAVDNSTSNAVYKGLAIGVTDAGEFLYATNFRSGKIDVFDTNFAPALSKLTQNFRDPAMLPGYAPFGIQNIEGNLYVTYAKQDSAKHDDVRGAGHGYVDIFDTNGHLIQRLASGGALNSPWAVVRAPAGFGSLSSLILIGNFGDGWINAFDDSGQFVAPMTDENNAPIVIGGLWGLTFGGAKATNPRDLYFTAGGSHELHGWYGTIKPAVLP